MKFQALFSSKDKSKKNKMPSAAILGLPERVIPVGISCQNNVV